MAKYIVYLNIGQETVDEGGPLAHIPSLPGCVARGKSREEALARLEAAVSDWYSIFGGRKPQEVVFDPVEEVIINTFPTDFETLAQGEIPGLLAQMEISRRALLKKVEGLSAEVLDWRADEKAWPIRWVLEHIAGAEWWYICRLEAWPCQLLEHLEAKHRFAMETVRGWSPTQRGKVVYRLGNEWTTRKILRLLLENEKAEREALIRLLDWYEEGEETSPQVAPVSIATVPSDLETIAEEEWRSSLEKLETSWPEIWGMVQGLSEEALDFKPEAERRSIRDILYGLAEDEWWLVTRLQDWPVDVFPRLSFLREQAVDKLSHLSEEELARVTYRAGEEWTARKVFRRFLEHEWEHREHIGEILDKYLKVGAKA